MLAAVQYSHQSIVKSSLPKVIALAGNREAGRAVKIQAFPAKFTLVCGHNHSLVGKRYAMQAAVCQIIPMKQRFVLLSDKHIPFSPYCITLT